MNSKTLVVVALFALLLWLSTEPLIPTESDDAGGRDDTPDRGARGRLLLDVRGPRDEAVAAARISVTSPGGRLHGAVTDETGRASVPSFRLDDFPFRLRIVHERYRVVDWRMRASWLIGRRILKVRLAYPAQAPRIIQLIGRDEDVLMASWDWEKGCRATAASHPGTAKVVMRSGRAQLSISAGPPGATLDLIVSGESSGWGARVRIPPGASNPFCVTLKGERIEGRVLDARGSGMGSVTLTFATPQRCGECFSLTALSDELGFYDLVLPCWLAEAWRRGERLVSVDCAWEGGQRKGAHLCLRGARLDDLTAISSDQ